MKMVKTNLDSAGLCRAVDLLGLSGSCLSGAERSSMKIREMGQNPGSISSRTS
jgi:hypothetical protein